tara:strand:+ start:117 stop:356 length:240 start_codon:yes stop_codon:yes gene_type:complete
MRFEKPTIWENGSFLPSARCPNCGLLMYLGDQCPHCEHWLSIEEQANQSAFWKQRKKSGILKGIVFFPVFILFLYLLFS